MGREIELPGGPALDVQEYSQLQDDAGAVLWDAGLVMIHYLIHQHTEGRCLIQNKTVLELGCGTAAVGMVAAALKASKVAVTDLPHLIPHIQSNLQANKLLLDQDRIKALPLVWGDEQQLHATLQWLTGQLPCLNKGQVQPTTDSTGDHHQSTGPNSLPDDSSDVDVTAMLTAIEPSPAQPSLTCADVILASDLVYQAEQLPKLCGVMKTLFSMPRSNGDPPLLLLSYEERPPVDGQFWECMQQAGLKACKVPAEQLDASWRCEDIHIFVITAA